jgi:hypothetical protein
MKPKYYKFYVSALIALLLPAKGESFLTGALYDANKREVLYKDDFTNLDPSWGIPGESVSVKDGKLILRPAHNTTQSVLNQSNVFDDADIAVDVILSTGDPIEPGGLIFWAKDYSNFYCLSIDANGSFNISHFVTDRWLTPVVWTKCEAMNKGIGQVNKLRVVTQGHQATAYINEKQVATFNDQPPHGGSCIGLSGGSGNSLQNAWQFTNIQVVAILTDMVSLDWDSVDLTSGIIRYTQGKTGRGVEVPIQPDLEERLLRIASDQRGHLCQNLVKVRVDGSIHGQIRSR